MVACRKTGGGDGSEKRARGLQILLGETQVGSAGGPDVHPGPDTPVCSSTCRRKHVAALLDVRGLHNTATRQEILAVARDLELSEGGALSPPRDRAFFSDIPVPRPSFCLSLPLSVGRLPLSWLARPSLACLPLRPRPLSPSRPRAQR